MDFRPLEWHSCGHCQRILLDDQLVEKEDNAYSSTRLPHTIADAYQAKKDGCPVFLLFPKIPFYDCSFLQSLYPSTWEPWLSLRSSSRLKHGAIDIFHTLFGHGDSPFIIGYHLDGEAYLTTHNILHMERMFVSCLADNPAAQDHSVRPISFEPNSEAVFSFLEEQLYQCLNVHVPAGSCQFQTGSRPPRRLLHIQREAGQPHLKLVEPAEGALLKWCALSYCWGDEGTSMTTRATLQSRLMSVKFDELPRTLREAILVCQRLNVSYIWIDSLCIVQDDEEEKMHDVTHMPDVYGQAFITLSASSASSANKGFLHTRDIAMRFPPFSLRYRCRDGAEGRLLFQPELYPKRDPTNRRGWTLQERVLSPRLIDFSSLQVHWRCQTTKSCDSGYPPSQWKWYFHATDYISRTSLQHMSTDDVIYLCKTLVEDYSQRQVTFPEDKLVAFSAIPTLLNRDGGYYAGLWAADFPFNLTWAPNGSPGGHLPPRPRKYRAPSWSWAALDVEVYFPCFIFLRPRDHCKVHAKVLECESKPLHPDAPFGAISSAYLKIRGRFAQAKWYFNLQADNQNSQVRLAVGCRAKNSRGLLEGKHDATEEGWPSTPEAHADVLCLLVVETSLKASGLLLMNEDSGAGFRRVGHWVSKMADVAEFAGPHSIWLV